MDPTVPSAATPDALTDALAKLKQFQVSQLTGPEWLALGTEYGLPLGMKALLVLVVMMIVWTISGWFSHAVRKSLERIHFDETLSKFLAKLARWLILLIAALICLGYFGIETTSFAAVLGAAGLAIGLAFQGTLSNFAAGGMLLIFRPYRVGDVVNIAGCLGKVDEIELFTTAIDTFDNRRLILPNSEIFGAVIENITFHKTRRVDVEVGTAYEADLDQTRALLTQAVTSAEGVLTHPEPAVVLTGLGASSVDWSIRGWAPTSDYGAVKQEILRAVKMHLDQANIGIPFPQMDVHVQSNGASS